MQKELLHECVCLNVRFFLHATKKCFLMFAHMQIHVVHAKALNMYCFTYVFFGGKT